MLTFFNAHTDIVENINEFKDSMFWDEIRMDAPERIVHGTRRVEGIGNTDTFISQEYCFRISGY